MYNIYKLYIYLFIYCFGTRTRLVRPPIKSVVKHIQRERERELEREKERERDWCGPQSSLLYSTYIHICVV